jgi:hypothetical protein
MSLTEAATRLREAEIVALLYETPSSTPEAPHWRVLAPTAQEHRGDEATLRGLRERFLARLNGVLGGVLAGESFVLSQSYYFGNVDGKPEIRTEVCEGWQRVDQLDDTGAIYKNGRNEPTPRREPVAAPDGLFESGDDPVLLAEINRQIKIFTERQGVGETPTGARVFELATWLLKLRVGDKIIDPAALKEILDEQYREVSFDTINNALKTVGAERGSTESNRTAVGAFAEYLEKPQHIQPVVNQNLEKPDLLTFPKAARVHLTNGATRTPRKIEWLWNGWLARGKYHVLAGAKGAGKSTLLFSLLAAISAGGKWPDGTQAQQGDVLVWSAEDDFDDTILPRFMAAGGDRNRLFNIDGVTEDGKTRSFDPSRDIQGLINAAREVPDLKAVMVDPIVMAVSGDSHKNAETRRGLQPLVDFAEARGVALIGITHFTKGTEGKDPVERVTGSLAFGALARVVLGAAANEDGNQRRLVRAASNIGPSGGGFEYALLQEPLTGFDFSAQRVMWGAMLHGPAKDLLEGLRGQSEVQRAMVFLTETLADRPVAVTDLKKAAEAKGHAWRTVERAKAKLPKIQAGQCSGGWFWGLTADDDESLAAKQYGRPPKSTGALAV